MIYVKTVNDTLCFVLVASTCNKLSRLPGLYIKQPTSLHRDLPICTLITMFIARHLDQSPLEIIIKSRLTDSFHWNFYQDIISSREISKGFNRGNIRGPWPVNCEVSLGQWVCWHKMSWRWVFYGKPVSWETWPHKSTAETDGLPLCPCQLFNTE